MPLLVRGVPKPVPPPRPVFVPPPPEPMRFLDRPRLLWISPSNEEWELGSLEEGQDATRFFATKGVKGLGAAPRTLTADAQPRGGTRVRHIQPGPRLVTLPIVMEAEDHTALTSLWRRFAQSFTDTRWRGPGRLRLTRPDGSAREIKAYYQDGWDVNPDAASYWDSVALTLYCPDPFWRDVKPTVLGPYRAPTPLDYLAPYPTITSSQTLGGKRLFNPGGVEAWPDWVITGPADVITATNKTTNESFTFDVVAYRGFGLTAGETITISTEPPTVRGPGGANWTGALNWPGCVLWGLLPGFNDVEFTASNVQASFSLTMEFYARHETA